MTRESKPLERLNRPADTDTERSMSREQLAILLEQMADRVRMDGDVRRYYAHTLDQNLVTINPAGLPVNQEPNAEVTTIRITWKKL